jgi:hypothetical protein
MSDMIRRMKQGDTVKLNPARCEPNELAARYILLDDPYELLPDETVCRVRIQYICNMTIPPVELVALTDIEPA